ncbi:GatB/YqeY domain-containing protein [Candidatus Saccharibacteria bacterium]|nr:GatB/YqeY domain-containing protein [Candidatus Saccharibacteria bacterium]
MSLKHQLDADLKKAMLAGDKTLTTTLRGLKSSILYAEVAAGKRDEGLTDEEIVGLLTKESKKRQESAELYKQGGNQASADKELEEKEVIAHYLPEQLDDAALSQLVQEAMAQLDASGPQDMGKVIGYIKQQAGSTVDGSRVAQMVKEKLEQ